MSIERRDSRSASPQRKQSYRNPTNTKILLMNEFKLTLLTLLSLVLSASGSIVSANFTSAVDVPLTAASFVAAGNDVKISLGYAPTTGTNLTVVNNTGLGFISGHFTNLAQGQSVALTYNNITYRFVANYYGGTGNDLVLHWANVKAYAWGENGYGQCGNNSTTSSSVPVAVTMTGVLNGRTVVAIAAGQSYSLALCADGTLAAWGMNDRGQLGNGSGSNSSLPVSITTSGALSGKVVVAIAAGATHSLALCTDGTLTAWGYNGSGALGSGSNSDSSLPVAVDTSGVLSGRIVVAIAACNGHSLALCSDGTLAAWGSDGAGGLGNVPVAVTTSGALSGRTVVAIAAGNDHNLAVCSDGTLVAWGQNSSGQLGNSGTPSNVPVAVTTSGVFSGKAVIAVAAGYSHSLGLCADGTLAAWGSNDFGQLGNNSTTTSNEPVAVTASGVLNGKTVVAIAGGSQQGRALCSEGSLTAWGRNYYGQLGNNSTSNSMVPVAVSTSSLGEREKFIDLAKGSSANHAMALAAVPISNDSSLSSLESVSGTLSPTFAPGTTTYTASIPNAETTVTVTPTVSDAKSTVTVNGTSVGTGTASAAIPFTAETITIVVTAEDRTTKSYTIALVRQSLISTLSSLTMSSGMLSPTFSSATYAYTAGVTNGTAVLTITPTASAATATIRVNGTVVASGTASAEIPLVVGPNTFTVVVTAEDPLFATSYTITVTRPSSVATLTALAVSSGTLSPVFASATTSYTASVPYPITSVTVAATVSNANATIRVNGTAVPSGAASAAISLSGGPNVLSIVITAQDGITTKSYTVVVTRQIPVQANFTSASMIAVTAGSYSATDKMVILSLDFVPPVGTPLTIVKNTGLGFITGRFTNLAQGGVVTLPYNNNTYRFVANYNGGSGNDLVLQWADNRAFTWGSNSLGQLGNNGSASSSVPVAVTNTAVLADQSLLAVATGSAHSLALCADGTIAAWGNNTYGQLGDNTTSNSNVPVAVVGSGALSGKIVVAIATGFNHSLALCSDGSVVAWGFCSSGQLGNGGTTSRSVPVAIPKTGALSGKTVVAIAAGYNHSLARCADGTVVAWGNNAYGQLGNNSTINSNVPVAITNSGDLSGRTVVSLVGGSDHSIGLCSDGSLVAWGRNNYGQLGNDSTTNSSIPVVVDASDVLAGKAIVAIASGGWHNLALCSDGTLAAFGRNNSGQLGNSGTTDSSVPVTVITSGALFGKTVTAIGGSNAHSLALCADGTLAAWGSNNNGQLGIGNTNTSNTPVVVSTSTLGAGERFSGLAVGSSASHVLAIVAQPPPQNQPFAVWQATFFPDPADQANPAISGELATPVGEGITNLMKYALGLNPWVCGSTDLPTQARQDGYLTLTYRKSKQATDVTYTVLAADSLTNADWIPATTILSQADEGSHWLITIRDNVPIAAQPLRFMRLRVSR
jgi:alpha-tubulin suppressor-like RCC1 family protein